MNKAKRDEIVLANLNLVRHIAYRLMLRLPVNVQVDDLIQSGVVGLIDASKNYDESYGASFSTYAGIRIQGSMFDEIRKMDWSPRSVHSKARQVKEVTRRLEDSLGRMATNMEIAREMHIPIKELHNIFIDSTAVKIFSLNETYDLYDDCGVVYDINNECNFPLENEIEQDELLNILKKILNGLPELYKSIVWLYYTNELSLREVGEIFGFTESWACIHLRKAREKIRVQIEEKYSSCF